MFRRIAKQSVYVVVPIAAVTLFLTHWDWRMSFSVLFGGAISLSSFRAVVWAVGKFLGSEMGQSIIAGLSFLKIMLIFFIFVVFALLSLIHPVGIVIGFTAVLAIIVKEGFLFARREA